MSGTRKKTPAKKAAAKTTLVTDATFTATSSTTATMLNVFSGGLVMTVGARQTFNPGEIPLMTMEDANRYANSVIYRDRWHFHVNTRLGGLEVTGQCQACDPIDRRLIVTIARTRPVTVPTSTDEIDHLILDILREIEDHERLEWLARLRPGVTIAEKLFRPHTPESANPFVSQDGFKHGEQVYADHDTWIAEHPR